MTLGVGEGKERYKPVEGLVLKSLGLYSGIVLIYTTPFTPAGRGTRPVPVRPLFSGQGPCPRGHPGALRRGRTRGETQRREAPRDIGVGWLACAKML